MSTSATSTTVAAASDVDAYWSELVTTALLGTDRRDPPSPPPGPLADLVADAVRDTPSERMITAVAACTVARRAGVVPSAAGHALAPPPADPRPPCPPVAATTLRHVAREWPVLEDEWVLTVWANGWRFPADVLVALLSRHRRDAVRRARVALVGGPVVTWLVDHVPELEAGGDSGTVDADAVRSLPELAVPPDLAELLTADARTVARHLGAGFAAARFGPAHRAVLVNLLARCRPAALIDAAAALRGVDPGSPAAGLALALADLAATRHRMLEELQPHGGAA